VVARLNARRSRRPSPGLISSAGPVAASAPATACPATQTPRLHTYTDGTSDSTTYVPSVHNRHSPYAQDNTRFPESEPLFTRDINANGIEHSF